MPHSKHSHVFLKGVKPEKPSDIYCGTLRCLAAITVAGMIVALIGQAVMAISLYRTAFCN